MTKSVFHVVLYHLLLIWGFHSTHLRRPSGHRGFGWCTGTAILDSSISSETFLKAFLRHFSVGLGQGRGGQTHFARKMRLDNGFLDQGYKILLISFFIGKKLFL